VRNHAEALVHSTEKTLGEFGDKVSEADKSTVETAISDLKTALEGEDLDAIKARAEALSQASMKLGEAMYQAQAAEGAGPEAGTEQAAPSSDDDVVDADFEEVKDDKKSS
jgi:molecular chaperone DnaK